jgi:outer membrane protein, heavy metal efflux system
MARRWSPVLVAASLFAPLGCAQVTHWPTSAQVDERVARSAHHPQDINIPGHLMAPVSETTELSGPQPMEVYIRRALAQNRTVQAAYHNVQSLRYRIPQVTVLDDPVASNTVFPIPSVAPQYSLMGYNPYSLTLAQQFPWYGTLRLRGEAAERDVKVALAELAAAQLDAVALVKRAYYDLYVSERNIEILAENRKILEVFHTNAKSRLKTGGTQQDVIRTELLINQLDREEAITQQGFASARASLARQLHTGPGFDLRTLPELTLGAAPEEVERLNQMAIAARPELQGRLAAIARDETAVELARKRFYPNVTLGMTYMDMEKTNALTPKTAGGFPNVGLFVGFNLPVYQNKYRAGVHEAQERALADAKVYEAQRDETFAEIKDFMAQAKAQQQVLSLLRDGILPRTRETLRLANSGLGNANVDSATALSAQREVLQVELQIVQAEGELGKALAMLERAVGCQINEPPTSPSSSGTATSAPLPAPAADSGPFRPTAGPLELRKASLPQGRAPTSFGSVLDIRRLALAKCGE